MRLQEARVLPDDVHDVGRDNSLVVLSLLHLCKAQEILNNSDEETFFRFFV